MTYTTRTPEETERLGEALAARLRPGDIVAFRGDLGAGKTVLTRGIARGLGAQEPVTSPTYTIVNEYPGGRLPLFHFDLYRLASAEELWEIGWEDYLGRGGVCCVEWSEHGDEAMDGAVLVTLRPREDGAIREITVEGGERFADLGL